MIGFVLCYAKEFGVWDANWVEIMGLLNKLDYG